MGHWGQTDRQASLPCMTCICVCTCACVSVHLRLRLHCVNQHCPGKAVVGNSHVLIQELFRDNMEVPSGWLVAMLLKMQGRKVSLVSGFARLSFHGALGSCEEGERWRGLKFRPP